MQTETQSRRIKTFLILTILFLFIAHPHTSFGKGPSTIPLTANIADLDNTGAANDIQSDLLGNYLNNVNGVTSFLTANGYNGIQFGDWQFDTYSSSNRKVYVSLDAADAVQPGDPHYLVPAQPPFWGKQLLTAHIEDKCTMAFRNMNTMTAGSSFTCPFLIRFKVGKADWKLLSGSSFGYPETDEVLVTCNSTSANGCTDWLITPIPVVNPDGSTSPGRTAMRLTPTSLTPNKGAFYIKYQIHLTRP